MGDILIIAIGVTTNYEEELMKYIIKQGNAAKIVVGLLNYETVKEAIEAARVFEEYKYKYYFVLGQDTKKLERILPPDRIIGFTWAHYLDLQDKKIFVINSELEQRIHGLRLADEGMCASITFIPRQNFIASNFDAFWEADIIIDESQVLSAKERGAAIIEKLVKEKNNEN